MMNAYIIAVMNNYIVAVNDSIGYSTSPTGDTVPTVLTCEMIHRLQLCMYVVAVTIVYVFRCFCRC